MSVIEKVKVNNILLKLLQIAIFVGAIYIIVTRLTNLSWSEKLESLVLDLFTFNAISLLSIVLLLQFVNWTLEAAKFRTIIGTYTSLSFNKSIKAIYAGNALGIVTPDKLGTFIGRGMYLKPISMTAVFSATMIGNFAQLSTTLMFGAFGFGFLLFLDVPIAFGGGMFNSVVFIAVIISGLILLGILFSPKLFVSLVKRIKFLHRFREGSEYVENVSSKKMLVVLLLSIIRYCIFSLQLYLLMFSMDVPISIIELIAFVGVLYVVTTVIPSPFLGNLGTREAVTLILLGYLNMDVALILIMLTLWVINIALPAIIGSILLLKSKAHL